MVDNVARNPMPYLRNIDGIFGDMPSVSLTRSYPKWTCFHIFIEELISSVVWEEAEYGEPAHPKLWVCHLLNANNFSYDSPEPDAANVQHVSAGEFIDSLSEDGTIESLCQQIAKQVFHVLFSNRKTMAAFGDMVSDFVLHAAPYFTPKSFTAAGHLKRTQPPVWARNAVFHRDKGHCVLCRTDLTKLVSQKSKIHFDHIVPLASGGLNCVTNLQLTCANCNLGKGARSSITSHAYEPWYDY